MKKNSHLLEKILLLLLFAIGFIYRIYGLNYNYSFWTDEDHVAIFSRAVLDRGQPILANGYFTKDQQLQYWLSAITSVFFGLNEFAIRLPSVIFGIFTIISVYLLGKEVFNRKVGLLSSFIVTFINIEILFSRQARPYQAIQFFYILGFYFIYRLVKQKIFNWCYFAGFLICGFFGSLMHGLGLVIFFSGLIYLLILKNSWFGKKWIILGILLFGLFVSVFNKNIFIVFSGIGKFNNLYYYRIFLTHNYLPLCLLAFCGAILLFWRKKYDELLLFSIILGIQIFIVSYFLGQPFTRYFYPVFGFIIPLAGYWLFEIGKSISEIGNLKLEIRRRINILVSSLMILLLVFSMWKSGKLSIFPRKEYSLNADMQEIPEVDWKKVYKLVEIKLSQNPGAVLTTNWSDLPVWYLGEKKLDYVLRKVDPEINDIFSGAKTRNNLEGLKKIINENPKGLLVLDSWDDQVPEGIREFSGDNLKKEFEIDRLYEVQPRYWPVTVYSWGLD